ncbi:hypothetical protein CU098_004197, partial [Rhizopus stolonifer]
ASFIYVPSEVLKTRLQLQGRYNNPHFVSGYNYQNTWHATKMIVKYDGFGALFHGFRATILRDVPYSAIQFACYEQFKKIAQHRFREPGQELPIGIDMITGSLAGGIAGAITTPLDVMKTLLQTQIGTKKKPANSDLPPVKHYHGILDGIGPRVFWTSLQSAIMFVVYEQVLHIQSDLRSKGEWPPTKMAQQLL